MTRQTRLDGPRARPVSAGPARQLIILLHGYGADGNDLIGLAPHFQRMLPSAAVVSPNAPERCDMSPMGRQWFSLGNYDPARMQRDPAHAAKTRAAMEIGAETAAPILNTFIDAELERQNLDDSALALVGFSQGTMMSLYVGLRRPQSPACILGFSGSLLGVERLRDENINRPPTMLIHGDMDDVVPVQSMFDAANGLAEAGVAVQWHVSHGVGHGIAPDGLELGGNFLKSTLAPYR